MQTKEKNYHPTRAEDWANSQPIADLLRKQRKGQFLTPKEKERIKREAEVNRKKNLQKNKVSFF